MELWSESHLNDGAYILTESNTLVKGQLQTPNISSLTLIDCKRKLFPEERTYVNRVNGVENAPLRPFACVLKFLKPYSDRLRLAKFHLALLALGKEPIYMNNILFKLFLFPKYSFSTLSPSSPHPQICLTPYPSFSVTFYNFGSRENCSQ